MRYFVEDESGQAGAWIMEPFKRQPIPPYRCIVAIDDEGRMRAGVLLNGYNGANIDITVRGADAITLKGLRIVFRYIFEKLQCTRVTAFVKVGRGKSVMARTRKAYMRRMGFSLEYVCPRYWGMGKPNGAYVWRMFREDCPWLKRYPYEGSQGAQPEGDGRRTARPQQANGADPAANRSRQPNRPNGHAAV